MDTRKTFFVHSVPKGSVYKLFNIYLLLLLELIKNAFSTIPENPEHKEGYGYAKV